MKGLGGGQRAKPVEIEILEGCPGKKPVVPEVLLPAAAPDMPAVVRRDCLAAKYWDGHIEKYTGLRLLSILDGESLGALCLVQAEFDRNLNRILAWDEADVLAPEELKEMVKLKRHNIGVARELRMLLQEFGRTPATRTRVKSPDAQPIRPGQKDALQAHLDRARALREGTPEKPN